MELSLRVTYLITTTDENTNSTVPRPNSSEVKQESFWRSKMIFKIISRQQAQRQNIKTNKDKVPLIDLSNYVTFLARFVVFHSISVLARNPLSLSREGGREQGRESTLGFLVKLMLLIKSSNKLGIYINDELPIKSSANFCEDSFPRFKNLANRKFGELSFPVIFAETNFRKIDKNSRNSRNLIPAKINFFNPF